VGVGAGVQVGAFEVTVDMGVVVEASGVAPAAQPARNRVSSIHPYLRIRDLISAWQMLARITGRSTGFKHQTRSKRHFLLFRTYAVDRSNVISSDERSEKSLKIGPANCAFRDFFSLRSSK
jgi:hypothetical protein